MDFFDDGGTDQIYVSGLPHDVTEEQIAEYFGQIVSLGASLATCYWLGRLWGVDWFFKGSDGQLWSQGSPSLPPFWLTGPDQDGQEEAATQAQGTLAASLGSFHCCPVWLAWE